MVRTATRIAGIACAAGLASGFLATIAPAAAEDRGPGPVRHVLLLSVDGMHKSDLTWFVAHHPHSALAALVRGGVEFTNARTPVPSDSFPGLVAQVTGGNPSSTGVYYDDTFNHALLPAGTTDCAGAAPGVEVTYFEQLDLDQHRLDAGQGLAGLPGTVLQMTGDPDTLIDPTQLPVAPATCRPVFPHSYLRVNTIFEVARAAGMRTAWSDKHPAYEILDGPSGTGVQDLFTPEINSDAPTLGSGIDWTADNRLTQQYDGYKVQAVLNEIAGFDHSGTHRVGTPAIFGMNFQTVSTAQKLPASNGLPGGYAADGATPGPLLSAALDSVNAQVGAIVAALHAEHLDRSTAVILSAKHGQSPLKPSELTRIPDGPIVAALDEAWQAAHAAATRPLVALATDDDGMLLWLNDRSQAAADFAKAFLLAYSGTGNDIGGNPKPFTSSGLVRVFAGEEAADYFGVRPGDSRVPDVLGIAQVGTVYTGGRKKIAEHGGANPGDEDVPLVVAGAVAQRGARDQLVETTRIAPTILRLLGLDPRSLQAVRIERTQALPVS